MADKIELDKKFQALPEHAQACAVEALRNVLSKGVDEDNQSSERIGRFIKKAFIALFEGEGKQSSNGIVNTYSDGVVKGLLNVTIQLEEAKNLIGVLREKSGSVEG